MCLSTKVLAVWRGLRIREQRIMRAMSRGSPDAVLRCRCKVILALVQGKSPTAIAAGGLCSASQVYRVAHRFIEQGPQGLPDRREDNGENKYFTKVVALQLQFLDRKQSDEMSLPLEDAAPEFETTS